MNYAAVCRCVGAVPEGGPLRDFTIAHLIIMVCFYNHVPFVINSGYTQDSRGMP